MSYSLSLKTSVALIAPALMVGVFSACSFQASLNASSKGSKTADDAQETEAKPAKPAAKPAKPADKPAKPSKPVKAKVTIKGSEVRLAAPAIFDGNSATLSNAGNDALQELIKYLQQNTRVTRLRIEGHTHNQRPEADSLALSGQRASALKAWFVAQGIAPGRLLAVGFGLQQPLESNANPQGQAKNERTVFHIAAVDGNPYLGADPLAGGTEFP